MANLDYNKLNRVQKMAVFLIVIGQESAASLVRSFADIELEAVCREMAKLPLIDDATQQAAIEEFTGLVDVGYSCVMGGASYVRGTLELARGEHRASYLLERVASANGTTGGPVSSEVLKEFEGMDVRQTFSLLKFEQPQTVAFVLSHLESSKAGEILRMLDAETRAEVLERLGEMDSTSPEIVSRIVRNLSKRSDPAKPPGASAHRSGGAGFIAGLLKTMDKDTSKSLLAAIQDRNTALSDTIRKKLFGFEDLTTLAQPDLQRVLREVDSSDLATSLKSPRGEIMMKTLAACMSKRAAEAMQEEILLMGPVRQRDQEAAQDRIMAVVRRLEEQGEISLDIGEQQDAA